MLVRNKHLACPKRQMELKMVQSICDTWTVTVQVYSTAFCVRVVLDSLEMRTIAEELHRSPWLCSQCKFIFVALFRRFQKGQCGKAELVHVKLWVQEWSCRPAFSSVALLLL